MNKKEIKFYSIGRGSLNLDGKFYYGLDYAITDFMRNLEQENNQLKEQLEKKYEKIGTLTSEILYEENTKLQSVLKDLRSWLEAMVKIYENEYKDVNAAEHYNSVLSKLNELEGGKNE